MKSDSTPTSRDPSRDDVLEGLVAECLERIPIEGDAAIESACREHPDYAADILEHLRLLGEIGMVGGPIDSDSGGFPDHLGPFKLVRRLGGGGMGVVFVAEQKGLHRQVALKVIRPEHLYFPGARARFQREVDAVSKLQHPGIVPIYTVGVDNGIPYFAMERIVGASLADVMKARRKQGPLALTGRDFAETVRTRVEKQGHPLDGSKSKEGNGTGRSQAPPKLEDAVFDGSWARTCLRIVRQVAYALEHAHARGVIHRDVKPSNIMITPSGRALLLDFGLARSEGSGDLTRSGSTLGSLPYMSPEQLGSHQVDHRIDVYSLGVTLYELLTLHQPFNAEPSEETRRRILAGRPRRIRELNPNVPWEVETICCVAMETSPERRYLTAADFARDIENVFQKRPIVARRPGLILRGRRWIQRNPTRSVAALALLTIAIAGPLVLYWKERDARIRIEKESKRAVGAEKDATAARGLAEERADLARAASARASAEARTARLTASFVQNLFEWAQPDRSLGEEMTARALVDAGMRRIGLLDAEPDVQVPLLTLLARVYDSIGETSRAVALWNRAEAAARAHELDNPVLLASIEHGLARIARERNRFDEAETRLERALELVEKAEAAHGDLAYKTAGIKLSLGTVLSSRGEYDAAEPFLRSALRAHREHAFPNPSAILNATIQLADLYMNSGRSRAAIPMLQATIDASPLPAPHPLRAAALNTLAGALRDQDQLMRSLSVYRRSLEMFEKLGMGEHRGAGAALYGLGSLLARFVHIGIPMKNAAAEAEDALVQAERIFDAETAGAPQSTRPFGGNTGSWFARVALGCLLVDLRRFDEAEKRLDFLENATARVRIGRSQRAHGCIALGRCLAQRGKLGRANRLMQGGIEELRHVLGAGSLWLASPLVEFGGLQWSRGEYAAAEAAYREAVGLFEARDPALNRIASPAISLGLLCEERGALAKAERWYRRAEKLTARNYPGRSLDAIAKMRLGAFLSAAGGQFEAEALLRLGHEALVRLHGTGSRQAKFSRAALAYHYAAFGDLETAIRLRGENAPRDEGPGARPPNEAGLSRSR